MQNYTMICSTCGCSLIRLGISQAQAVHFEYQSMPLVFCCQGCLKIFKQAPDEHLKETSNNIVCPTCLSEKNIDCSVSIQFKGEELYFCRCPYCLDTFNKNPEYYLEKLSGKTDFKGLFSDDEGACCH